MPGPSNRDRRVAELIGHAVTKALGNIRGRGGVNKNIDGGGGGGKKRGSRGKAHRAYGSRKCFNCKLKGHLARECPLPTNTNQETYLKDKTEVTPVPDTAGSDDPVSGLGDQALGTALDHDQQEAPKLSLGEEGDNIEQEPRDLARGAIGER